MTPFDYLSVLNSIVLGLGITQLLSGFASMMRSRRRVTMYWPVPVQMAAVFLITVQLWWALFTLQYEKHWNFAQFLVVLMQPVSVFLAAALITPDFSGTGTIDLREDYFHERQWFFASILFVVAASVAKNLVLWGHLPQGGDLVGHLVFVAISVVGMTSKSDLVHKIIAPLSLLIYCIYIGLLFLTLPG